MPRVVDHEVRRREIAEALWRVARREGIDRISVRTVAAEAGTSPGALRHYFTTQAELEAFSLQSVVDRAEQRLARDLPGLSGRDAAMLTLEQYLPLDAERRAEIAVYLTFLGRPHSGGPLATIRLRAEARSREGVALAVECLADAGLVHPSRDPDAETDRLYPLVDGLAMHGTLWPRRYPAAHLRAVLAAAVDALAAAR